MNTRFELVATPSRLAEIGPQWDRLWAGSSLGVFQSHGWVMAWWRSRPESDRSTLCIGLGWSGDQLTAIVACVTRWHRGVRVLEWAAKECSDYCDAVVDPNDARGRAAVAAVWAEMSRAGRFDIAYLSHVRPDASIRLLAGDERRKSVALRPGPRADKSLQVRNYEPNGHAWFRSLNKKARNNHTRGKRIVSESGAVEVRLYQPDDDIGAVLDRMIVLKREWLVSTGQSNRLLDNDARTLRALIAELVRQGVVQVFSLDCGGAIVAASVNILHRGRMQAFFATYDPRFDRASPGTLIMVEYLIWAFDHGIAEVDFLCGEEGYKYKFANAQTDLVGYVGARTLLGRATLMVGERLDWARLAKVELPVVVVEA